MSYVSGGMQTPESKFVVASYQSQLKADELESDTQHTRIEGVLGGAITNNCDISTSLSSPLRDRSNCRWYEVKNIDDYRYPRELFEVRCTPCVTATDPSGFGCRDGKNETVSGTSCEPVHYWVRVLRAESADDAGNCVYVTSWQRLAVACTCMHKAETNPI